MEKNTLAQYAHLKNDLLGDGIKESKLSAIQDLYLKLYKAAHPDKESGILPGYKMLHGWNIDPAEGEKPDLEYCKTFSDAAKRSTKYVLFGWDSFINSLPLNPNNLTDNQVYVLTRPLFTCFADEKIMIDNTLGTTPQIDVFFASYLYMIRVLQQCASYVDGSELGDLVAAILSYAFFALKNYDFPLPMYDDEVYISGQVNLIIDGPNSKAFSIIECPEGKEVNFYDNNNTHCGSILLEEGDYVFIVHSDSWVVRLNDGKYWKYDTGNDQWNEVQ